ncbi:MAG: DNA-directed RNA polymerase subunit omega [Lachnospirales bacterium]
MLKPSYSELINIINEDRQEENEIYSRYSVVIATSKRAREIIGGSEPLVNISKDKPVSCAVEELNKKLVKLK